MLSGAGGSFKPERCDGREVRRTPDTRRTGSPSYVMYAERNLKNLWRVFGFLYGLVVLTLTNPHHSA